MGCQFQLKLDYLKPSTSGMKINACTVAMLVIGLGGLSACDSDPVAKEEIIRPVRAMQISDATAYEQRRFPGKAEAHKEVNLAFRVSIFL